MMLTTTTTLTELNLYYRNQMHYNNKLDEQKINNIIKRHTEKQTYGRQRWGRRYETISLPSRSRHKKI